MDNVISIRRAKGAGDHALTIPFDTDDPEFVRGYECGLLHAQLDACPPEWRGTYHATNREMLRRIAEAHGYDVEVTSSDDPAWVFADFTRRAL